ncbi:MAG: ATP-binding protein [Erysipelotrichaceae bacterium]|nr:ATP-binding protein [Erysipelotrichaceae bacterium]
MTTENNKNAVLLIGLQGSGKSTFYNKHFQNYIHISLDELHTRNKEMNLILECLEEGKSFVVDNTNPAKSDRQRYIPVAKENGYKVTGYYFAARIADCIRRNSLREGKSRVPDKAILATYNRLEIPSYDEGFDELYYVILENDEFKIEEWKDEI